MAGDFINTAYGFFSAEFIEARLADVCVKDGGVQTGPFGSQLHAKDYVELGTPIITVEHLGNNRLIHENLPRVSNADKKRLVKYSLNIGDIVFSRVGSVDRRARVHPEEDGRLYSGRCLRIRPDPKKISPNYLSWFLGLPGVQAHIRRIAVGATMPSLNTKILSDVLLYYPVSFRIQRSIAHILDTLDNKIELNRRMNRTLEKMAAAIFKSWFIDFDPVRAKAEGKDTGLPQNIVDLFPDSFVDSELGEIPKGWSVSSLGDILELAYGKSLRAQDRIPGQVAVFGSNGQVGWHNTALVQGPGIVVGRKGNPGIVTWTHAEFFPIDTTFYVIPKGTVKSLYFLFHVLKIHDLASLGADSAVPGLNRNMAYMSQQVVPSKEILLSFDNYVKPLFDRNHLCFRQNRCLANMRDTILPKLLSGEIELATANTMAEENC